MDAQQTVSLGNWWLAAASGTTPAGTVQAGVAPGGKDALRLATDRRAAVEAREKRTWPVTPGRAYCLAAPIRTALVNAYGQLRLLWLAADGTVIAETGSSYTFLEHDYAPLQIWALAPAAAVAASAGLRLVPACPDMLPPKGLLWLAPAEFSPSLCLDAAPRATAALFDADAKADYFLTIRGAPPDLQSTTVRYVLSDYERQPVADGAVTIPLNNGAGRLTLALPARPPGYYELALAAESDGVVPWRGVHTLAALPLLDFAPPPDYAIALDAGLCWPTAGGADSRRTVTAAAACARVGLRMLRDRMSWRAVNPAPGQFDWGQYRRTVDMQRATGLDVYPVFHDSPAWAQVPAADDGPAGRHPYPPADPRTVYEFTRRLALDLGDAVRCFELWNEPDIFFFAGHPWDLAAVIKAGFLGIKDADPTLGVLNASRCAGLEFWRCLLANGVGPYVDIWNQHYYGAPENLFALIQEDRDLLAAAGIDRPIWMSEMGQRSIPARDGSYVIAERVQVSYLLRAYACGLAAGLDRFMYFYLQEFLEYGVNLWGLQRGNLDPKPAFVALATLIRQVRGAKVAGFLQEGQCYCVVFERAPGDHVALVWSVEGSPLRSGWDAFLPDFGPGKDWAAAEGSFDLPVKPGAFLVNPVGTTIRELTGPTATVKLSVEPVFVRGLDVARLALKPAARALHYTPSRRPAPPPAHHVWLQAVARPGQPRHSAEAQARKLALHIAAGQAETAEFRIHNWTLAAVSVRLAVTLPAGWTADGPLELDLTVLAGATASRCWRFLPNAALATATLQSVNATLRLDGETRDTVRIDYVTTPSWSILRVPAVSDLAGVAAALAHAPAHHLRHGERQVAEVSLGATAGGLLFFARFRETAWRPNLEQPWKGTAFELLVLKPEDPKAPAVQWQPPAHQIFLVPRVGGLGATALRLAAAGDRAEPALEIRIGSQPMPGGCELAAIIPWSHLGFASMPMAFPFELAADVVDPATDGIVQVLALDESRLRVHGRLVVTAPRDGAQ